MGVAEEIDVNKTSRVSPSGKGTYNVDYELILNYVVGVCMP